MAVLVNNVIIMTIRIVTIISMSTSMSIGTSSNTVIIVIFEAMLIVTMTPILAAS